jgi:putative colanic acid biosynthesis acetyltransferase WcaF
VLEARVAPGTGEVWQRLDLFEPAPYQRWEYAAKLAWWLVQATIFRCTLPRMHRFRCRLLRLFGARIGKNVGLRSTVRVYHPWLLSVGDFSSLGEHVTVYNLGPVVIGSHTAVSQNVHLCAGTHEYRKAHLPLVRSSLTIGSGVWVCADAFIGPGVVVGDNALVGARAVVSRDVPPGVIVAGNPATIVKDRPRPQGASAAGGEDHR